MVSKNLITIFLPAVFCFAWIGALPTGDAETDDLNLNPRETANSHICGKNQFYSEIVPDCEAHCGDLHPTLCNRFGTDNCLCEKGYVRDSNGVCIKIEDCPKEFEYTEYVEEPENAFDNDKDWPEPEPPQIYEASDKMSDEKLSEILEETPEEPSVDLNSMTDEQYLEYIFGTPKPQES